MAALSFCVYVCVFSPLPFGPALTASLRFILGTLTRLLLPYRHKYIQIKNYRSCPERKKEKGVYALTTA